MSTLRGLAMLFAAISLLTTLYTLIDWGDSFLRFRLAVLPYAIVGLGVTLGPAAVSGVLAAGCWALAKKLDAPLRQTGNDGERAARGD